MFVSSSSAVRFGRIPKREKQRLLDEMQSYMNSLNESATMDMDSSPVREAPPSTEESDSKEAIGAISRAYHDIFVSSQDRTAKRRNINNNNNPSPFHSNTSQEASYPIASSHPSSTQGYQSCPAAPTPCFPVAPNDNHHTFPSVDNSHYRYSDVSNQNHGQSSAVPPQRGSPANYNSFSTAGETQNQFSCPWKLAAGAKVLVSTCCVYNLVMEATQ